MVVFEGALLVGIGCELDGHDGGSLLGAVRPRGLFGNNGPEVAIALRDGEREDGVKGARVEVGQKHGRRMKGKPRG